MAFELVKATSENKSLNNDIPKVHLLKNGIYFNKGCCKKIKEKFGYMPKYVCVLFDKESGDLGFKFNANEAENYRKLYVSFNKAGNYVTSLQCSMLPDDIKKFLTLNNKFMSFHFDSIMDMFVASTPL